MILFIVKSEIIDTSELYVNAPVAKWLNWHILHFNHFIQLNYFKHALNI